MSGDKGGNGAEAARVTTSIFMPKLQCAGAPQMKYRFPGEVREIGMAPLGYTLIGLLFWQAS